MNLRFWLMMTIVPAMCVLTGCEPPAPDPVEQATSLYGDGDWNAAVAACTSVLVERPDDVEMLILRGRSHVMLERYDLAISDFSRVIAVRPDDAEGYYQRQLAYQRAGQHELAEADGNAARRLDPQYQLAYIYESQNFTDTNRPVERFVERESKEEAEDGVELNPRDERNDRGQTPDKPRGESTVETEAVTPPWSAVSNRGGRETSHEDNSHGQQSPRRILPAGVASGPGQAADRRETADQQAGQAGPQEPDGPQSPPPRPAAGDRPSDQDLHDKWLAEQRRLGRKPNEIVVPDGDPPSGESAGPAAPRPVLSTSLPAADAMPPAASIPHGMPAAPGVTLPRTTGISSQKPVPQPTATEMVAGPRPTGLRSPVLGNGGSLAGPSHPVPGQLVPGQLVPGQIVPGQIVPGQFVPRQIVPGQLVPGQAVPGQFQGNTLYPSGRVPPPLSTSLPGTAIQAPGQSVHPGSGSTASPQQPVLSTQLPPERTVRPAAGRPTGTNSNNRPSLP